VKYLTLKIFQSLKEYTLDDQAILASGKFVVLDGILQEKKELVRLFLFRFN
jgi:hypothetical protein